MNNLSKRSLIYLLLVAVIFILGLSWPVNKIALQYMGPIGFAECRLLIGTTSMFIFALLRGKLVLPTREDIPIILIIGILQRGLFLMLISLGLHYNDVGHSVILVYSTPLWVTPISFFFFKEKLNFYDWIGLTLGISGLVILLSPWQINWNNRNVLFGNGMLLLAAIFWAIAMLSARYMKWRRSSLELAPWQLLVGTILLLPFTVSETNFSIIHWNYTLLITLLYTGILATAFAYWGVIEISKRLPPFTASLNFLGVPACGLLFSWTFLHESPSSTTIIAISLIFSGLLCSAIKDLQIILIKRETQLTN